MIETNKNVKSRSRRRFLLASGALGLSFGGYFLSTRSNQSGQVLGERSKLVRSIIDTMVPSRFISAEQKGAIDLGIDQTIEIIAKKKPSFNTQLNRLIQGVDQQALTQHHKPYPSLDIDQRETLLNALLDQKERLLLRADLTTLRNSVLDLYYSSSAGHKVLGYTLPANYPNY